MAGFLLLYGSQTGQAKGIAEEMSREAAAAGITCRLFCLDEFAKVKEESRVLKKRKSCLQR